VPVRRGIAVAEIAATIAGNDSLTRLVSLQKEIARLKAEQYGRCTPGEPEGR
jgi:hypothetical protein